MRNFDSLLCSKHWSRHESESVSHSVLSDSASAWTVGCQAPLSIEFSRQEYWSAYLFPSPGDLPIPGIKPRSPTLQWILYCLSHQGSPRILKWVAYPFSNRSSQPRNRTGVSCIARNSNSSPAEILGNLPANARGIRDADLIPGLRRSPGGRNGNSLQYFCLENSMDRGAWWAIVHGVKRIRRNWATKHTPTQEEVVSLWGAYLNQKTSFKTKKKGIIQSNAGWVSNLDIGSFTDDVGKHVHSFSKYDWEPTAHQISF